MTASRRKLTAAAGNSLAKAARSVDALSARRAIESSSIEAALVSVGDRWSLAIIRAAFLGARRFEQFIAHLDVPKQTLSDRLKDLVALGVLIAEPYQNNPVRSVYRLSSSGFLLYPNALASWSWEQTWGAGSGGFPLPARLHHKACGQDTLPRCVCGSCHQPAALDDITFSFTDIRIESPLAPKSRRWSQKTALGASVDDVALALGLSVDRWALLIIYAAMLGNRQFDALQSALGVGSSVLANRLTKLCAAGLLDRREDPADGRRYNYELTPPALGLFDCLATLSEWGRLALRGGDDSIVMTHAQCGSVYHPLMTCGACTGPLVARDVAFFY